MRRNTRGEASATTSGRIEDAERMKKRFDQSFAFYVLCNVVGYLLGIALAYVVFWIS